MTLRVSSAVAMIALVTACGGAIAIQPPEHPPSAEAIKQLWVDPGSEPRDLSWGIGRPEATHRSLMPSTRSKSATHRASARATPSRILTAWNGAPRSAPRRRRRSCSRASSGDSATTSSRFTTCRRGRSNVTAPEHTESEARFRPKLKAVRAPRRVLVVAAESVRRHARVERTAGRSADVQQHRSEKRQQRDLQVEGTDGGRRSLVRGARSRRVARRDRQDVSPSQLPRVLRATRVSSPRLTATRCSSTTRDATRSSSR